MKKLLIIIVVLFSPIYVYAVASGLGTLIVKGAISENTCQVSTADQNKAVVLPIISKDALASMNSVAGTTKFSITLENCPSSLTKAGLLFNEGTSVFSDSGYMKAYKYGNTTPGSMDDFPVSIVDEDTALSAESNANSTVSPNLAFQLLDSSGKKVTIGSSSQSSQSGLFIDLVTTNGSAGGTYYGWVEYINYSGSAIDPGYYFSHVGFTIQYP